MTDKQSLWRRRNNILWRLKGIKIPIDNTCLTNNEIAHLNIAFHHIRQVIKYSTESSIQLGFNAKKRCKFCGKIAVEGKNYCSKHLMMEQYE